MCNNERNIKHLKCLCARIKKEKLCVVPTYEGVLPKDVTVKSEGRHIEAKTYIFRRDKKTTNPPKAYLQTMIDGLWQHGYGNEIRTYEAKQLLNDFWKEKAKNPKLNFEEFTRTWKTASL